MLDNYHKEPVFVGGFPGSGTRVVSRILSAADIFMGSRMNTTSDSVYFAGFLNNWVGKFIIDEGFPENDELTDRMKEEFLSHLETHLQGASPQARWGSKNPRNILILPFLHALFPAMKFIHVLRDGRDLAASPKKRVKIKQYSKDLLDKEVDTINDLVELWGAITLRGFEYGEKFLGENYLLIRFEDLCADPHKVVKDIFNFIGNRTGDLDAAIREVSPPQNAIGRWKNYQGDFSELSRTAQSTLQRFAYE